MKSNPIAWRISLAAALAATGLIAASAARAEPAMPKLHTLQEYLENLNKKTDLNVNDPMAVLEHVLSRLPDRVKVYPTENYYYFSFMANGAIYEGNIRLDASDRDQGMVNFGYVEKPELWRPIEEPTFRLLSAKEGVKLEKLAELSYRLTYKDRSVIFDLNDLASVKPPEGMLNDNEVYIGPSFDESGIAFYLVFNKEQKVFHFLYDEKDSFPERFDKVAFSDRITLGRRTGFAFYKDLKKDRQILIGVNEANSYANNYFDGPFDQLPDNFIQGETLREAILALVPDYRGKIDRYGGLPGGAERYAISPYLYYRDAEELKTVETCVNDKTRPEAAYYQCFNLDDRNDQSERAGEKDGKADGQPEKTPADGKEQPPADAKK